jgi:two-component system sensor histidine kinase/response regulator
MADTIGVSEEGVVFVDLDEGLNRVGGNVKLYVKLLNKFKDTVDVEGILAEVRAQDYEKAQISAHTLKGVAANLSLQELFSQAREIEARIKDKTATPEAAESLRLCYNETIQYLDKVIAQYG